MYFDVRRCYALPVNEPIEIKLYYNMNFFSMVLRTGIPFGISMGAFLWFFFGHRSISITSGVLAGVLFGICMALFASYQRRRFQAERPDFHGEELIHEGPANHFFHGEGVGGWLYLTTGRLLFRSHRVNLQPHETDLPLNEISTATPSATAGFIPNGLSISTASGAVERFVVEGRKQWSDAITNAKNRNA